MNRRVQLLAWLLFLLSSVLFLASAIVAGDPWAIVGSLLFGVGVALFLTAMRHGRSG